HGIDRVEAGRPERAGGDQFDQRSLEHAGVRAVSSPPAVAASDPEPSTECILAQEPGQRHSCRAVWPFEAANLYQLLSGQLVFRTMDHRLRVAPEIHTVTDKCDGLPPN